MNPDDLVRIASYRPAEISINQVALCRHTPFTLCVPERSMTQHSTALPKYPAAARSGVSNSRF